MIARTEWVVLLGLLPLFCEFLNSVNSDSDILARVGCISEASYTIFFLDVIEFVKK